MTFPGLAWSDRRRGLRTDYHLELRALCFGLPLDYQCEPWGLRNHGGQVPSAPHAHPGAFTVMAANGCQIFDPLDATTRLPHNLGGQLPGELLGNHLFVVA